MPDLSVTAYLGSSVQGLFLLPPQVHRRRLSSPEKRSGSWSLISAAAGRRPVRSPTARISLAPKARLTPEGVRPAAQAEGFQGVGARGDVDPAVGQEQPDLFIGGLLDRDEVLKSDEERIVVRALVCRRGSQFRDEGAAGLRSVGGRGSALGWRGLVVLGEVRRRVADDDKVVQQVS